MKTKEQVLKYLSIRSFSDEDWELVKSWMHDNYDCGLKKARRPKLSCSYSELLDWNIMGLGEGDIVVTDDFTGIVHDTGAEYVAVAYNDSDGVFCTDNIVLDSRYRLADDAERLKFLDMMRKCGFGFNTSLGVVSPLPLPPANKMISFTYQDAEYIGIAKQLEGNDVVFWVTMTNYGKIERDRRFPAYNIEFSTATKAQQQKLQTYLQRASLFWDDATKMLLSHIRRGNRGADYYYINDRFEVSQDKDTRGAADEERYKNRNYFLRIEEALRFRQQIINLRAEF